MSAAFRARDLEGLSLLVVDDNPVVRIAVVTVAARLGIVAHEAMNGDDAIASLHRYQFDAMLIDLRMPGLDGTAVTRTIRAAAAPWSSIPIIGMTATVRPDDEAHCIAAGMTGLMGKPVQRDSLEMLLSRLPARTDLDFPTRDAVADD